MDAEAYDPRTKNQLKDAILLYLYEPLKKSFDRKLKGIIQRNSTILNSPYDSFFYRGKLYVANINSVLPRKMNRLAPQLVDEMETYLKEEKELNSAELPYVTGFIIQVLNSSNYLQDYLRIFPESLHPPIEKLIASCGCQTTQLSPERVEQLKAQNAQPIAMIKQRLVLNLLE